MISNSETMDIIQLFNAFAGNSQNYRPSSFGRPDVLSSEAAI